MQKIRIINRCQLFEEYFLTHYFFYLAKSASNEWAFNAAKLKRLNGGTEVKCFRRSWDVRMNQTV